MNKIFSNVSKIICCLLLIVLIGGSFEANALAQKKDLQLSELELNTLLKENGFPNHLIHTFDISTKKDIVDNNAIFLSFNELTTVLESHYPSDEIGILGTIPSSDFYFNVTATKIQPSPDNRVRIRLYTHWDWLNAPFWRLTDPFGVAWDGDVWRPVENTASFTENYCAGGTSNCTWYSYTSQALAYTDRNGVGWNADLRGSIFPHGNVIKLRGWSNITIETKSQGLSSGSDTIFANYSHVKSPGSYGLNYGVGSIGFSGSASEDSRGTFVNFNY